MTCMPQLARPAALLLVVSLAACQTPSGLARDVPAATQAKLPEGVQVLDADLSQALARPASALPPLSGPRGVPITTCNELLTQLRSGFDLGEQRERREFAAWSNCLAGGVIAGARPSGRNTFDLQHAGQQILMRLDLATVPSSLAQRRPAEHYRLTDFQFSSSRIEPLSLELVSEAFRYNFVVLASADFRGTGSAALLVRFTQRASAGSYDSNTLLILESATKDEAIVATDAIEHLQLAGR